MNPINYSTEHTQVPLNRLPGGRKNCDILNDSLDFMIENTRGMFRAASLITQFIRLLFFSYHQAENVLIQILLSCS